MPDFAIPGLMNVPPTIVADCPRDIGTYHSRPVYYGDRWPGIPGIRMIVGGQPPPTNLLWVELSFYKKYHAPGNTPATGAVFTSATSAVQITSAAGWTVVIPGMVLPLDIGLWELRIRTNDAIEGLQTRVVGTIEILA